MTFRQLAVRGSRRLHPVIDTNRGEVAKASSMPRQQRDADIIAARIEVFGEIAQRLGRIATPVQKKDRWIIRPAREFECFGAGNEALGSDGETTCSFVPQARCSPPRHRGGCHEYGNHARENCDHPYESSREVVRRTTESTTKLPQRIYVGQKKKGRGISLAPRPLSVGCYC